MSLEKISKCVSAAGYSDKSHSVTVLTRAGVVTLENPLNDRFLYICYALSRVDLIPEEFDKYRRAVGLLVGRVNVAESLLGTTDVDVVYKNVEVYLERVQLGTITLHPKYIVWMLEHNDWRVWLGCSSWTSKSIVDDYERFVGLWSAIPTYEEIRAWFPLPPEIVDKIFGYLAA